MCRRLGELSRVAASTNTEGRETRFGFLNDFYRLACGKMCLLGSSAPHACELAAGKREQRLDDGSKPQALPGTALLCNSRPKAITHGACQTGLALSHNHTCIGACVIVSTYMNAHPCWAKMCTLDASDEPL